MTVSASLSDASVTVEPGSEATLPLQVLNSGSTVEEVRFDVVGPCADWATVRPESLTLYPGDSATATVALHPPRSSTVLPGELPLGLRVIPTSDTEQTVIPEHTVTVLPFTEVSAELVPPSSHGAWRGVHKVAVDNRGNTPLTVLLTSRETTERVQLAFAPAELTIPAGQARFATVRVRPAARMWRGTPLTHPYQTVVAPAPSEREGDTADALVLDGSYEQQPLLPRWLPRALIAAVLAAALLVGLWYTVLRPTVRSAARDAITPEAIESAIAKQEKNGGGTDGGGSDGKPGPKKPSDGTSPRPGEPGGPAAVKSARAQVRDAVGGGATTEVALEVPKGKTFELTDLVVQNPQGDAGTLVVSSEQGQLLHLALENFRDSDYHFVTPVEVPAGGKITLSVTCREVGKPVKAPAPSQCSESLFLGGTLHANPEKDED